MKILRQFLTFAAFLVPAAAAHSATLPVFEADGLVFVDLPLADGSTGQFFDTDGDDVDIAVAGLISGDLFSDLLISDLSGVLLSGDIVVGSSLDVMPPLADGTPTGDSATIMFSGLSGSSASLFDTTATVVFTFFAEDEVGGLIDPVNVKVFSDLTPIPLPASLPLLGFVLAGGALMARRKSYRAKV